MSWSIAIVCEAPADRDTASCLATRAVREAVEWMEPEYLAYRGFRSTDSHLLWKHVKTLAAENRVTVTGFMRGEPPSPDAHNAMRALLLFTRCVDEVGQRDGVLLIRDSDNDLTRHSGLNQARDHDLWPFKVVIGFAHTKRECWHISGFEAEAGPEREVVGELSSELGFDFRRSSEELTAKHDNDKRSAKRVLSRLTEADPDREHRCLTHLPLTELKARGRHNRLAAFLEEVERHLVPLFAPPVPPG
ncbi:MAG: hypothetical protein JWO38_3826 [Gemmataceae bacterium]|nr:hypothetical protein [Gemmataceae bacterium]